MATLRRITAGFTNGICTIHLPQQSETVALRLYEQNTGDGPQVAITVMDSGVGLTYPRIFALVEDGAVVPPNFKKYIGGYHFRPTMALIHVVELQRPQEPGPEPAPAPAPPPGSV